MAYQFLIVDDSHVMRRMNINTIKRVIPTAEILDVSSGEEAIELAKMHASTLSLILMDINMPDLDGFQTIEQIKKIPEASHIPIIIVSTEHRREDILRAKELGVRGYLNKPYDAENFRTKLLTLLT